MEMNKLTHFLLYYILRCTTNQNQVFNKQFIKKIAGFFSCKWCLSLNNFVKNLGTISGDTEDSNLTLFVWQLQVIFIRMEEVNMF